MSLRALVNVLEQSDAQLGARLVLLALADHAHDDGSNAWPAVGTIAKKARLDERTVQRCLKQLAADCEIVQTGTTTRGVRVWHLTCVTPLSCPSGVEAGGDNLSPEDLSIKGRLRTSSGGKLPPLDVQDVTPPAAQRHPYLPPHVLAWLARREIRGMLREDVAVLLEDNLRLHGQVLAAALEHWDALACEDAARLSESRTEDPGVSHGKAA